MAKKSQPLTPEFRRQMIELARSGRSPESLAKAFELTAQTIRNWVAQAGRDAGTREDGATRSTDCGARPASSNRSATSSQKAAAWFARETAVIPPKGSDS